MAGRVRQAFNIAVTLTILSGLVAPPRSADATSPADTTAYVPVGPVRLADTRSTTCGCTRLDASTIRVEIAGRHGVPDDVAAVAVTVTALPTSSAAFVTAYPSRTPRPLASTLNTRTNRVTANSTIVPVGSDGALELYHLVPGDLVVDVTGVFVPAASATSGRFVAVATRRLVDTREPGGTGPPLRARGELTVPLPAGVSTDATAVIVNVTSVGDRAPGFLSARPAGTTATATSFLNVDGSGQATAASVIVPVSTAGLTLSSLTGGHVVVDLIGWFTGPSAPSSTNGLFRPVTPTRLVDTRLERPRLHPGGSIEVPMPMDGATSVVTNVTVTDADRAGFVTAFPAGTPKPGTSAVNPAFWNHTVANTAVTRVSDRGVAYWSLAGTDLVIDLAGWFVGDELTATRSPLPNAPSRSRVFIVGDSTLAGVGVYASSLDALRGFDGIVDGESCRRLLRPSCLSDDTGRIPNTVVEAILGTPGRLDIVMVKAGYNDWFSDFPREFDAVVNTARSKGAHTIVFFTLNEGVNRVTARRAYEENNVDLRRLTTLPQYADVILADWYTYSDPRWDWFHDGTHVNRTGAYAITDYVARWVAALEHRACPRPWAVGLPVADPCPSPDLAGAVPDPVAVAS
jgi:hypothetical protein